MNNPRISGESITKNWALNLLGQGAPVVLGLLTIPWLVRYLGIERFGTLSLCYSLLGYLGQLDFGLGRATTKYMAECLGRDDKNGLPGWFWTALFSQIAFGVAAGVMLAASTPTLVNRVLRMSPALLGEASSVLYILALSLPLIVAGNSVRGLLEAGQQFGIINCVRIPANASVFLLPVLGIPLGFQLPGMVLSLVVARVFSVAAYLFFCFKLFPELLAQFGFDRKFLKPLFAYGSWVTVSTLIGPLLMYVDRFFVGSSISMTAVGYYTAPYEIVTRVWVVPASLLAIVFPAFSSLHAAGCSGQLGVLYVRSLKFVLLTSGSVLLVVAAFAHPILNHWLGQNFAVESAAPLQILALGVWINCVAFVPFGLLQGLGRPDLTAKIHLVELPFYALTLSFLLPRFGLPGAAWASTLRMLMDFALLFWAVLKFEFVSPRTLVHARLPRTLLVLGLPTVLLAASWSRSAFGFHAALFGLAMLLFVSLAWAYALDDDERTVVLSVVNFRARLARAK